MIFKNSLKLLVANFSVFWKLLLYKIIAILVCALLFIPVLEAWKIAFNEVGFIDALTNFATNTVFSPSLFSNLFLLVQTFIQVLIILFNQFTFAFFYSLIIVLFVLPFLLGLSSVPTGEGLYSYMASLSKSSFTANFVSKLGRSALYSLFRTLIMIPFIAVMGVSLYYLLSLTTISGFLQVVLPMIIVLYLSFMLSLFITIFCAWMPATVVFNISPIASFKKAMKGISRRFFKVFSVIFVLTFFTTLFTFMMTSFSLIAFIPLLSVLISMLEMVMFFESQSMRYYVDLDSIISPKKLEQYDKIKKVKNII